MQRGYDVNGAKGTLDAGAAARSGCWFGMTKSTEGVTFVDPLYRENRGKILAANDGRCVSYHFCRWDAPRGFYVGSPRAAQQELAAIIATVGPLGPHETIMVDFEEPLGVRRDDLFPAYLNLCDWLFTILDGLRAHYGRAPIVYTYADFWHRHGGNDPRFLDFPLNLAAYQMGEPYAPPPWPFLTFWQHTSSARIPGISGNADEDYFYGDQAEWDRMCGLAIPPSPSEEPMRDPRVIHVPAPDSNGKQWVLTDVDGKLLAKFSTTSSVQACAQDDGSPSDVSIQPYDGYADLLALGIRNAGGTGPAPEGLVRILIERRD